MPTIGAAVTAEIKERFDAIAHSRDVTASRLAASLVINFVKEGTAVHTLPNDTLSELVATRQVPVAPREEAKTKQVFVRLEPSYFELLDKLAGQREWYRGTYLANLFYAHADRRPVLCEAEINAVRQVARQLSDIGRNINQIAKKLNASPEHAHLVSSVDFELVKMLIELENNAIKELMKANIRGWGVNYG